MYSKFFKHKSLTNFSKSQIHLSQNIPKPMAVSFSNHSLLAPQFSASSSFSSLKPSNYTKIAFLPLQSLNQKPIFSKPISGFSPSNVSFPFNSNKNLRGPIFKASVSSQESAHAVSFFYFPSYWVIELFYLSRLCIVLLFYDWSLEVVLLLHWNDKDLLNFPLLLFLLS